MRNKQLAVDYVDRKMQLKLRLPIKVFKKPENDREYYQLEKVLDALIDEVRGDEHSPLALVMQIIGDNLEQYDNYYPAIGSNITDIDMVKYLMGSHQLTQKDLADIFGGQGNVSKFLNGERSLSKSQIAGLKEIFHLSADFFIR